MKSTNLILGILAGAAVGVIGALLFTPHKGSVMRKIITRKGEEYVDLLEEKMDDWLMNIDSHISEVKKEVAGFVKEATRAHEHSKNGHAR
jgi:gas vesicle protein